MDYTPKDLILCESADGWSLHAPGSTDEEIAHGDAPYILSGEGRPSPADRNRAFRLWHKTQDPERGMTFQDAKQTAFDLGKKAGTAAREGDWSRVRHWQQYFAKWVQFQARDYEGQAELKAQYHAGYRGTRP